MGDAYAHNYFEELAPQNGQITAITVSTSAASQDLQAIGQTAASAADSDKIPQAGAPSGMINRRMSITAVTANLGVVFGPNVGAVSNANAPNLGNTGANTPSCCYFIPAGQERKFFIHPDSRFIGFVGSGAGSIVMCSISRGI